MRTVLYSTGDRCYNMYVDWLLPGSSENVIIPVPCRRVRCKELSYAIKQGVNDSISVTDDRSDKVNLTTRQTYSQFKVSIEAELGEAADCFAEAEVSYTIIRPTILATILQCDSAIMSSFSSHLLSGKSLSYNCPKTAFVMKSVVTSSTFSLPIARGFSRISTVFFSFFKGGDNAKEVTTYNHPLAGAPSSTDGDTLRFHLSLELEVSCFRRGFRL